MRENKEYKASFFIIPAIVLFDENLKTNDALVYAVIYLFTHLRHGKCVASNQKIADEIGSTPHSVANSISRLSNLGYIKAVYSDSNKRNRQEIIPLVSLDGVSGLTHELKTFNPQVNRIVTDKSNKKDIAETSSAFVWEDYLKSLEESKQRHLEIIGFFFREKGLRFDTKKQAQAAIRRHLRPAKDVGEFSDKQIVAVVDKLKKDFPKFTIETILKELTK